MSSLFPNQESDAPGSTAEQRSTAKGRSPGRSIARIILLALGGMAVVAVFFFGTLFVLDYGKLPGRDSIRADHAKSIKAALEQYRATRGAYPFPFSGNPLTDLKKELVDGGYLPAIPEDPLSGSKGKPYQYVSSEGRRYGVLFHLETSSGAIPAGGACMFGVGTAGSGWWGQPPNCPF